MRQDLAKFLPGPRVRRVYDEDGEERYELFQPEESIGRLHAFHGNFGMFVRAYTYIRMHGAAGLRQVSEDAVLDANYIRASLRDLYDLPFGDRTCMHETVFSATRQKAQGVRALDIAKRILDFGIHPPTVYFPLVVPEALMIEPTETESKESLDHFIGVMRQIAHEAAETPEVVQQAPHTTEYKRLDEVAANRTLNLRWRPEHAVEARSGSERRPRRRLSTRSQSWSRTTRSTAARFVPGFAVRPRTSLPEPRQCSRSAPAGSSSPVGARARYRPRPPSGGDRRSAGRR